MYKTIREAYKQDGTKNEVKKEFVTLEEAKAYAKKWSKNIRGAVYTKIYIFDEQKYSEFVYSLDCEGKEATELSENVEDNTNEVEQEKYAVAYEASVYVFENGCEEDEITDINTRYFTDYHEAQEWCHKEELELGIYAAGSTVEKYTIKPCTAKQISNGDFDVISCDSLCEKTQDDDKITNEVQTTDVYIGAIEKGSSVDSSMFDSYELALQWVKQNIQCGYTGNIFKGYLKNKDKFVHEPKLLKTLRFITYQSWVDSKKDFSEFARVNDIVDEETVGYFLDVLPPVRWSGCFLQIGEAYSHEENEQGEWKPIFTTFAREDGAWVYKGHCFLDKTENVA